MAWLNARTGHKTCALPIKNINKQNDDKESAVLSALKEEYPLLGVLCQEGDECLLTHCVI
jgi:hypothetical protein